MSDNTSIEQFQLFTVPVFRVMYDDAEKLKDILMPKFLEQEKQDKDPCFYPNGYTNYGKKENILFEPECNDLLSFIGQNCFNLHSNIGLSGNVFLQYSWYTIGRKYSYHEPHNHLPSTWSGVYYVDCSEDDAPLVFMNRNTEFVWPYPAEVLQYTSLNANTTSLWNKTGHCVFFPSYLTHKVEMSANDTQRTTIAFNFGVTNDQPNA